MAERRMFAKKIVESDAFTELPATAQLLYFHLSMAADDDGVVNKIRQCIFMSYASQEDFDALVEKKFVIYFKEKNIAVIKHWRINNQIRKDRHHETDYKEELNSLYVKENGAYTDNGNHLATTWQPNGNQMATESSIGKSSIVKDSLVYTSSSTPSSDEEAEAVAEDFNQTCKDLPRPIRMTPKRKKKVDSILKRYTPDDVHKVFCKVQENEYLKKKNTGWLTFDWIFKDDHFDRIIEGNYDNQHKEFIPGELGDVVKKLMEGG